MFGRVGLGATYCDVIGDQEYAQARTHTQLSPCGKRLKNLSTVNKAKSEGAELVILNGSNINGKTSCLLTDVQYKGMQNWL